MNYWEELILGVLISNTLQVLAKAFYARFLHRKEMGKLDQIISLLSERG